MPVRSLPRHLSLDLAEGVTDRTPYPAREASVTGCSEDLKLMQQPLVTVL